MDIGYARVSPTKQNLGRQLAPIEAVRIPAEQIYVDKKSGATTARIGLAAALLLHSLEAVDHELAAALRGLSATEQKLICW